eukprot:scaffold3139_cov26-Tisochrysis_lutea.AAC.1
MNRAPWRNKIIWSACSDGRLDDADMHSRTGADVNWSLRCKEHANLSCIQRWSLPSKQHALCRRPSSSIGLNHHITRALVHINLHPYWIEGLACD